MITNIFKMCANSSLFSIVNITYFVEEHITIQTHVIFYITKQNYLNR